MNTAPDEYVLLREEQLLAFARTCLERSGLDEDQAALVSRLLVNSDLRGVRSHGTRLLKDYCRELLDGELNPRPDIQLVSETPTTAVVEGDGGLGYWPTAKATEHAVAKAQEMGLGMATVRNIGHYGAAGHYVRMCMDAGCIGFSVQGKKAIGDGREFDPKPQLAYIGNPPICFGFPSGNEPPVILDAATCILADDERGPESDAIVRQIPAAFFKSVGYVAAASLLGGALAGTMLPELGQTAMRWKGDFRGGMVMAIRVDSVVDEGDFRAEVDRMVRDVRETYEPFPGYDQSFLPGAIEEERMARYRNEGIPYGRYEQGELEQIAPRLEVALPWD